MTDMVTFLRARLNEDAELAASGEGWSAFDESTLGTRRVDVNYSIERVTACTRAWRGEHIARHDPARVLAEVAAKRRIIDIHAAIALDPGVHSDAWIALGDVLHLLATAYADHPDYRPEWAPAE